MHTFPRFATHTSQHTVDLVREHPFALVVSAGGGVPVATHCPVILEPGTPAAASPAGVSLVGATLLGHMARVNPQWRTWQDSPEVLVVFSGPTGYVSPTVYAADPSVPTWNYAAVHLTGRVTLLTEPGAVLDVVEQTVAALESGRVPAWDPHASRERFRAILPGVAAFRIHVHAEQSLFKLSQDQPDPLRGRVHDAFAGGTHPNVELAALMRRVDPRPGDHRHTDPGAPR